VQELEELSQHQLSLCAIAWQDQIEPIHAAQYVAIWEMRLDPVGITVPDPGARSIRVVEFPLGRLQHLRQV
jgi:hypothetical protein